VRVQPWGQGAPGSALCLIADEGDEAEPEVQVERREAPRIGLQAGLAVATLVQEPTGCGHHRFRQPLPSCPRNERHPVDLPDLTVKEAIGAPGRHRSEAAQDPGPGM
jgi:hypothetical protein